MREYEQINGTLTVSMGRYRLVPHRQTAQYFVFCASRYDYLRIDTHQANIVIQTVIKRFGFNYC